jgi:hypothetical protein
MASLNDLIRKGPRKPMFGPKGTKAPAPKPAKGGKKGSK